MAEIAPLEPQIRNEAMEWVLERTVGIYGSTVDGNPVLYGTGILLQIADAPFLVTASHVAKDLDGLDIRLDPCGERATFVRLGATTIRRTQDESEYDFAYARLSGNAADELRAQRKKFVRLDSVDDAKPGWYCVVGFPRETTRLITQEKCITTEPVMFETHLYEGSPPEPHTPGVSITLKYDGNTIVCARGERPRIPDLHGISGCGIWRLYAYCDHRAQRAWDPSAIRLVGIEHTLQGSPYKAVKGVGIEHVVYQIACIHPELAPSIRLTWADMPALPRTTTTQPT